MEWERARAIERGKVVVVEEEEDGDKDETNISRKECKINEGKNYLPYGPWEWRATCRRV
jgi:hypothetical protein